MDDATGLITDDAHRLVHGALTYYDGLRGDRPMPRRADVDFTHVGRVASRTMIVRVGPEATLDDMVMVNVGTEIEEAAGGKLTGLSLAAFAAMLAEDDRTAQCLHEYADAARDGQARVHVGECHVGTSDGRAVRYERVILPLAEDGARVDHILVFVDLLFSPSPPSHHPRMESA